MNYLVVVVFASLMLCAACQPAAPSTPAASPGGTVRPATATDVPPTASTAEPTRPAPPPTLRPPSPTAAGPGVSCPVLPAGSFADLWQGHPNLQAALGCPTSNHPRIIPDAWEVRTSYQAFERGAMLWSDHVGWYPQPVVYVLYADSRFERFDDTFDPASEPEPGDAQPPPGLVAPTLGFGNVWRTQPGVREALGWAVSSESPGAGRFQMFTGGAMIWAGQTQQTYVFEQTRNTVSLFAGPFSP